MFHIPYNPEISLLGIDPTKRAQWNTCLSLFRAAPFSTDKNWKGCRCSSTAEWMSELCYSHTLKYMQQ